MGRIIESFKTIVHLGTHIQFFNTVIYSYRDNEDYINQIKLPGFYENAPFSKAVSGFLQNYSIIIICSFLDELDKEFTPIKHPDYAERILKVKNIIKPIRKRINKWTDLKNFRNYILAHNLREKDLSIFSEDYIKKTYKIPFSNSEHYLLGELVIFAIQIITSEFTDVIKNIDLNENILSRIDFTFNEIDAQKEFDDIRIECLKRQNEN